MILFAGDTDCIVSVAQLWQIARFRTNDIPRREAVALEAARGGRHSTESAAFDLPRGIHVSIYDAGRYVLQPGSD